MESKNVIVDKTYKFALRIIGLNKYLINEKKEYVLCKQLLRCGTSIGANVKEAAQAESRPDFIHKLSIALKETSETEYWINLLHDSNLMDKRSYDSIITDCVEIIKLLTSILKTSRSNLIIKKVNNKS
ncbi:MAG: four helix bundle protein [Ignavibacteria bacterium]|nr:four helix bundle protein [Ignavibacteria bacterium]